MNLTITVWSFVDNSIVNVYKEKKARDQKGSSAKKKKTS